MRSYLCSREYLTLNMKENANVKLTFSFINMGESTG
jgi:hypothetical protein